MTDPTRPRVPLTDGFPPDPGAPHPGSSSPTPTPRDDVPAVVRAPRRRGRGARWAAAILAVAGVAAVGAAFVLDEPVPEPPDAPVDTIRVATPLLSARRVPEWTTRPFAGRALTAAVQPVADAAPPATCIEVGDGRSEWYEHNTTVPLVPASNLKLLTTAAALDILGADHTLTTTFASGAVPVDGVVTGNLFMVGGGDPLLTTEADQVRRENGRLPETDLEAAADQLVAAGVRQVTGSVVGDASRYDDQRTLPGWPERWFGNGTVAPLSALLVNDAWQIDPTTGTGPGGAAPDPAAHAAGVMTQLLTERGVVVAGPPRSGEAPDGSVTLLEVPSLPMSGLVGETLRYSDNTSAELLLKEIGLEVNGDGSTAAGAAAVAEWAAAGGLPTDGVVVTDGSGLSDTNLVTCDLLAALLRADGPGGTLAESLAVPGEPGTLDDRFRSDELPQRLRAKTGTLNDVTSLSGWLTSRPGTTFDFEIVTNTPGQQVGTTQLALQNQLVTALLDQPASPPVEQAGPVPLPSR